MKPIALIIEDNENVREVVEECVADLGHEFHSARSESEALKHLERHRYDYILLDLELPTRFGKPTSADVGRRLLRTIKAHPTNGAAPVLSMSAHFGPQSELGEEMIALGASAWIGKPFDDLGSAIRVLLERHSQRKGP